MNIGEEQAPIVVPIPVHPDDLPVPETDPEPEPVIEPAEPVKVPA